MSQTDWTIVSKTAVIVLSDGVPYHNSRPYNLNNERSLSSSGVFCKDRPVWLVAACFAACLLFTPAQHTLFAHYNH